MYFFTKQPSSLAAPGLYERLKDALTYLGVDQTGKLIDLWCDGASVNLGARALKGLVKEERLWIVVVWCFAYRLELAIKDALKNTFSLQSKKGCCVFTTSILRHLKSVENSRI